MRCLWQCTFAASWRGASAKRTEQERTIKSLFWLAVLVSAGIYGSGSWTFREVNVSQLLENWEEAAKRGDADAICNTLAPDMTFSTHDTIGARVQDRAGGRAEFCEYLDKVVPLLAQKVRSTNTTRDNLTVTRDPLHWWTAEVSYTEHEETTLDSGLHMKTEDENHLTLVKTVEGLRVRRLDSHSRLVSANGG
jgi:hypothetical protein